MFLSESHIFLFVCFVVMPKILNRLYLKQLSVHYCIIDKNINENAGFDVGLNLLDDSLPGFEELFKKPHIYIYFRNINMISLKLSPHFTNAVGYGSFRCDVFEVGNFL